MERSNYPATYRAMSEASANSQRTHFRLLKLQVAILFSIVMISAVNWQLFPAFRTVSIVAASFLIVLTFVQLFAQIQRYDRRWFVSRAVAESVKVQMWRFMMKVSPYQDSADTSTVIEHFVADVQQMLKEQQNARLVAGSTPVQGTEISQFMLDQRNKSVGERRDLYVMGRIQDQKDWYSKKAVSNSKSYSKWFAATFVLQGGSGVMALLFTLFPGFPFSPAGIVATLATSGISWMNAKSYRELSQSYGLIAHDLAGYESVAREADSQENLEKLVSNVEGRISGEHTYWKARRLF
ncbi:MAG TPA: DUF4231 domain-containing protein [Candidatus Bathyarchaeia archaeon]|nr:DUF4231 domain-containing protein [Candidatus Bathyarchaeia archaeon]